MHSLRSRWFAPQHHFEPPPTRRREESERFIRIVFFVSRVRPTAWCSLYLGLDRRPFISIPSPHGMTCCSSQQFCGAIGMYVDYCVYLLSWECQLLQRIYGSPGMVKDIAFCNIGKYPGYRNVHPSLFTSQWISTEPNKMQRVVSDYAHGVHCPVLVTFMRIADLSPYVDHTAHKIFRCPRFDVPPLPSIFVLVAE